MLWKCCTQYASKFGKLSSAHKTGKGQLSFQSPKRQCQRMLKLPHNYTHLTHKQNNTQNSPSQASIVHEIPDVQAGFRKSRGSRDQIANMHYIIEKAREFQKNIYVWFIDYAKAFGFVDDNKLLNILKKMEIPDHLTYLLRNLDAGQEATIKTGYGATYWFQIGKVVHQHSILSPCLFNYAEYIMWNAELDETQPCIKIARKNINNFRYTDDTVLTAEIKEEQKILLMKVKKKSEKIGLKLKYQKKIMASQQSMTDRWGNNGNSGRLYFLGLQNHCRWWLQPWNLNMVAVWKKSSDQLPGSSHGGSREFKGESASAIRKQ